MLSESNWVWLKNKSTAAIPQLKLTQPLQLPGAGPVKSSEITVAKCDHNRSNDCAA